METFYTIIGIIGAVLSGIGGYLISFGDHKIPSIWFFFSGVVCLCLSAALYLHLHAITVKQIEAPLVNTTPEKLTEPSPDIFLITGNGPTPAETKKFVDKGQFVLLMGGVILYADKLPHDFIVKDGEPMFSIGKEGDKCWLSAKLFASDGTIICELLKNQIFINKDNVFRIEKSANRVTVFDKKDFEIINFEAINPSVFRLIGKFYIRGGLLVTADNNSLEIGVGFMRMVKGAALGQLNLSNIK